LLDENEIKGGVIFKIRRDPRITGVGKFLRRFSLDELPQLFNILKGDMSLVGPRPALPEEVKQYSHLHSERLGVRPGLTGLSQVRGRSDLSFARYVRWDIWYVNNWTFGLDFQILLWTVPAVLRGKGSY
jgi:lipopolysaccharide/colanic/teichoic acid biosynthesis glycosyltransferase